MQLSKLILDIANRVQWLELTVYNNAEVESRLDQLHLGRQCFLLTS